MVISTLHRLRSARISFVLSSTSFSSRSRRHSTNAASGDQYEEFFKHTSGRWIHNEAEQLSKLYHRFNVDALKRIAAEAAGAASVLSMRKLVEGRFNKAFLLSLDNGKEVVARLPTSSAGPSYLVTANEVATMDFVRSHLGIPAPRVISWSSSRTKNEVESDYIIMEKAEGVELDEVWKGLSSSLKGGVISELVRIEKLYMKKLSGGYGGLYYRGDIDASESRDLFIDGVRDEKFVLGPATPTSFWRDGKSDMDSIDRGPWDSSLSYILAISNREREWIKKHAVLDKQPGPFSPPTLNQTPEAHIALLDKLITVAPHLVPPEADLIQPALCHRDLNTGNIFLSKEHLAQGEIKITSIIDWQHAAVVPLYLAVRCPAFLQIGDITSLPFDPLAALPDNLTDEQRNLLDRYLDTLKRYASYTAKTQIANSMYHDAYSFPTRGLLVEPLMFGGIAWPKHFIAFRESLFNLVTRWDELRTGVPCPISFSDEEWKSREADFKEWQAYEQMVATCDAIIGVSDGWVSVEGYDAAITRNKAYMDAYIAELRQELGDEAGTVIPLVPDFWIYRPWEK